MTVSKPNTACSGINILLRKVGLSFPASVAGLILILTALLLLEVAIGNARTKNIVNVLDVPMGWALRWINLFFVPSFVTLPLNSSVNAVEVAKIIAVFVVGWVIMMTVGASLIRGLQLLFGTHKKSHQHADESGGTDLEEMFSPTASESTANAAARPINIVCSVELTTLHSNSPNNFPSLSSLDQVEPNAASTHPRREINPSPRVRVWASKIIGHLDTAIFGLILLAGVPVYCVTGYAMPVHLGVCVLSYQVAMYVPARHRTYLHPILVSATASVLIIWALGAIRGDNLYTALHQFKTGVTYHSLLLNPRSQMPPGGGDMLIAVLDAGIIALSLPMHKYRRELREHLFIILLPCLALSVSSLFAYPSVCYAIGISAEHSLALASRSLTVALAIPATENLGGDLSTVAAVAVMSGIIGALIGQRLLNWMRIPKEDYVTRGITLGANSAAIITALLLQTDPRAAAMSSLSMSLFGTITVILSSVPPIASTIRSLVS
ncbi:hypothetical protein CEP51_002766 [Fusarium floridanum]|uniref:LrgB-like protein n=1 Tax=Fusarium floridanum TaxID=1325733 RepID=A0A428S9V4_9HYPO|nr:hypothetical protein CEP51_002766 [Fusarium floridanum]